MEDLLMALDGKEREISEFLTGMLEEREKLIHRLNELDVNQRLAEEDLSRIRGARTALQRSPEELLACAEPHMPMPPKVADRAVPAYRPNRPVF